jgi:murein DD-endopeptidase MepM/ murein hydrolase activator NlpD
MITNLFNYVSQLTTSLPRFHGVSIVALCCALAGVGLSARSEVQNGKSNADISPLNQQASAGLSQLRLQQSALASESSLFTSFPTELPVALVAEEPTRQQIIATLADALLPATSQSTNTHIEAIVKAGDTLASVFERAGVDTKYMYHLLNNNKEARSLAKIFPGHTLSFILDEERKLAALRHASDELNTQVFTRYGDDYGFESISRDPEITLVRTEGTITHSLYQAGKDAQLEDKLTMSLASIFGWDIDFVLDIRKNDRFTVIYENQYLDGKLLGSGEIVSAEFINRGKQYRAVRYTDSNGDTQYYTPEGDTMRKAFLRSPIEFARISSPFNLSRKHPILNTIRAHKGVDYAAPRGTPIKAAGDGKVVFAGTKGGYGNTLVIQHGQTYQTLYAHLNKFANGMRRGKSVKQGQTVGYVGTTGLATGPHLHYEFQVNGVVRNPVTVKLPKAEPIAKAERERFFAQTATLVAQLSPETEESPSTKVASQEVEMPPDGTTAM